MFWLEETSERPLMCSVARGGGAHVVWNNGYRHRRSELLDGTCSCFGCTDRKPEPIGAGQTLRQTKVEEAELVQRPNLVGIIEGDQRTKRQEGLAGRRSANASARRSAGPGAAGDTAHVSSEPVKPTVAGETAGSDGADDSEAVKRSYLRSGRERLDYPTKPAQVLYWLVDVKGAVRTPGAVRTSALPSPCNSVSRQR
jgi:hypothetical protein